MEPQLRKCLHQRGPQASLWGIFLTDSCRRAQPTMGSATSRQVVLGSIKKAAERDPGTHQWWTCLHGFCFSPCYWDAALSSCFDFHQWWLCSGSVSQINLLYPKWYDFTVMVFTMTIVKNQTRTGSSTCMKRKAIQDQEGERHSYLRSIPIV